MTVSSGRLESLARSPWWWEDARSNRWVVCLRLRECLCCATVVELHTTVSLSAVCRPPSLTRGWRESSSTYKHNTKLTTTQTEPQYELENQYLHLPSTCSVLFYHEQQLLLLQDFSARWCNEKCIAADLIKTSHMDTQIKIGRFNYLQCLVYFLKVVMYIGGGVDWTQVR